VGDFTVNAQPEGSPRSARGPGEGHGRPLRLECPPARRRGGPGERLTWPTPVEWIPQSAVMQHARLGFLTPRSAGPRRGGLGSLPNTWNWWSTPGHRRRGGPGLDMRNAGRRQPGGRARRPFRSPRGPGSLPRSPAVRCASCFGILASTVADAAGSGTATWGVRSWAADGVPIQRPEVPDRYRSRMHDLP